MTDETDMYGRRRIDFGQVPHHVNNPQLAPFLDPFVNSTTDFTRVAEDTALKAGGNPAYMPEDVFRVLNDLRVDFPFLPILPFPNTVRTLFFSSNAPQDLQCPDQAKLVAFTGRLTTGQGDAPFFISIKGNARTPDATDSGQQYGENANMSFNPHPGFLFYCGNIRSFSVVAPTASTVVTAMFYIPKTYGRNFG